MGNPYNFNNPTTPDRFVGRWDIVNEIIQDLYTSKGDSHAIIAGKRCGKTSLLHMLRVRMMERLAATKQGEWHVLPVWLDMQQLENTTPCDTYRGLVRELRSLSTNSDYAFTKPIFPLDLDTGVVNAFYSRDAQVTDFDEFREALAYLRNKASKEYGPVRFVFLIDEVDEVSERDWTKELFGNLRSLANNPTESQFIRYVMAGSARFLRAQRRPGSPLLNMFKRHYLTAFSDEAMRELIELGGEFPEDVIQAVIRHSGGHPYIAQFLMHYLWDKRKTASKGDVRAISDKLHVEYTDILEAWYEAIGYPGRQVFQAMAKDRGWLPQQRIRAIVADSAVDVREGLIALLYHNLIIRDTNLHRYRCGSELFRQWFLAREPGQRPRRRALLQGNSVVEKYADFYVHVGLDGTVRACSDEGERTTTISLDMPSNVHLTMGLVETDATDERVLKDFGSALYDLLFAGPIHTHFNQTEARARERCQSVRIRLTIKPDALARVPWEFIFRKESGDFLAINPNIVLSRYLELPIPRNRVRQRERPLDLLLVIANPNDQPPLDPDRWDEIVTSALRELIEEGELVIRRVKVATRRNIRDALFERSPDIVQFVGHGIYHEGRGYLALVNDAGKTWAVDDERFATIFLGADDRLGLVTLAACESAKSDSHRSFLGIAPRIVQKGVPAVVAMQYKVRVSTAEVFLEDFYKAVAARNPIDWAVQWARKAVALEAGLDNREFATPVLYMRAKDGNVF